MKLIPAFSNAAFILLAVSSLPPSSSSTDSRRVLVGSDTVDRFTKSPQDLSCNLIVQLGTATEDLNRSWYERNTGRRITDVQRHVKHSAVPWMAATLDGIVEGLGAVFESKFMLPWSFSEEGAVEKYMA